MLDVEYRVDALVTFNREDSEGVCKMRTQGHPESMEKENKGKKRK